MGKMSHLSTVEPEQSAEEAYRALMTEARQRERLVEGLEQLDGVQRAGLAVSVAAETGGAVKRAGMIILIVIFFASLVWVLSNSTPLGFSVMLVSMLLLGFLLGWSYRGKK